MGVICCLLWAAANRRLLFCGGYEGCPQIRQMPKSSYYNQNGNRCWLILPEICSESKAKLPVRLRLSFTSHRFPTSRMDQKCAVRMARALDTGRRTNSNSVRIRSSLPSSRICAAFSTITALSTAVKVRPQGLARASINAFVTICCSTASSINAPTKVREPTPSTKPPLEVS
jgi:hypothetical protein